MSRDELVAELVWDIKHAGVDFRSVDRFDAVAVINPTTNQGIYDINVATPMDIAHEYYHKIYKHRKRLGIYDVRNPNEREANEGAVKLLWNIWLREGGTSEYTQHFLEISGVAPYQLERLLVNNLN